MIDLLQKLVSENIARTIAQRDFLARLLAHVASLESNPEELFQKFSAAGDKRLLTPQEGSESLVSAEFVRSEFDWMLLEARDILSHDLR